MSGSAFASMEAIGSRLFFLHVPKCAGLSVIRALRSPVNTDVDGEKIYTLDVVKQTRDARRGGIDPWVDRDQLLSDLLATGAQRVVAGHFRYHRSLHRRYVHRWTFSVLFRKPREMLLSYYHFAKARRAESEHFTAPLTEWLETGFARNIAESYVQLLQYRRNHNAFVSEKDVDQALCSLEDFELVGVLEKLSTFEQGLSQRLNRKIVLEHANQSPAGTQRHERLDGALMSRIDDLCAPSQRVYEAALDRAVSKSV